MKRTLFFLLASCLSVSVYAEQFISPELVEVKTPRYPSSTHFKPKMGRYIYEVSWTGIGAAEIAIDIAAKGKYYAVETAVKTYSGIDLFYKLRYSAQGLLAGSSFMPKRSFYDYSENSRRKRTWMTFDAAGKIHSFRKRDGQEPEIFDFDPNNGTLDPFAAIFVARAQDWELGAERTFDTFNGKTRYLVSLKATDKTKLRVNGQQRDVWVIEPKVKKLNYLNSDPSKLRRAQIYVTADDDREILTIKSEVFVGSVKTKLKEFIPAASDFQLAHNVSFKGKIQIN